MKINLFLMFLVLVSCSDLSKDPIYFNEEISSENIVLLILPSCIKCYDKYIESSHQFDSLDLVILSRTSVCEIVNQDLLINKRIVICDRRITTKSLSEALDPGFYFGIRNNKYEYALSKIKTSNIINIDTTDL